ncbi:uncharacterized protein LOC143470072 [Clavelina lepadiformis]|uniref:uncharacterized protein LOC143470072 n=1 Tax=Clavelina lepadiformis TaxID=159417 RepID=UPI004042468D
MVTFYKGNAQRNQLEFNLDVSTPSNASYRSKLSSPGLVMIEKLHSKSGVSGKSKHLKQNPIPSDKLSLALQLAKLDISTSQKTQHEVEKEKIKVKRNKVKEQTHAKEKVAKCLHEIPVQSHESSTPVRKHPISKPSQFKSPIHKRTRTTQPNMVAKQKITELPHNKKPRNYRQAYFDNLNVMKDACVSTADIYEDVNNFAESGNFKQFSNTWKGIIRKEKLRKHIPASKSGFLSMYRSPRRKKKKNKSSASESILHERKVKKVKDVVLSDDEKVTDISFEKTGNKVNQNDIKSVKKVTLKGDRPRHKASLHVDPMKGVEETPSMKFRDLLRSKLHFTSKEHDIDHDDDDGYKDLNHHYSGFPQPSVVKDDVSINAHEEGDLDSKAKDLDNLLQCESLYQRLVDIQNEEDVIRHRWKQVRYDDIPHQPQVNHFKNSKQSPELITISHNEESPVPFEETVLFKSSKQPHQNLFMSNVASQPSSRTDDREMLRLPKDIRNSVISNRTRFTQYLKSSFHEPKGKFNPWKIVDNLADEMLDKMVEDVCGELFEGCDDFVEHLFEDEFADPSASHSMISNSTSYT